MVAGVAGGGPSASWETLKRARAAGFARYVERLTNQCRAEMRAMHDGNPARLLEGT